ncbi:hypothetical protein BGW37DRAFT_469381 [Umbelopsis sp. PMI_123]|nr:hypothetical protein BGW37DRAFT_469381 [Umbelopsis sp. PMI_123]
MTVDCHRYTARKPSNKQHNKQEATEDIKRRTIANLFRSISKDGAERTEKINKAARLCYELKDKRLIIQLLDQMEAINCPPDDDTLTLMLMAAVPNGDVLFQSQVLARVGGYSRLDSANHYDALIQAMCHNLELERILDSLDDMEKKGITPARKSYISVLELALKFEDASTSMVILNELEKHNMITEEYRNLYLQVLRCAALSEDLKIAMHCWDKGVKEYQLMPDHGTLTYLMLLSAKMGSPRLGSQVLEQMGNSDLQYSEHHLAALLQAFSMSGDLKGAFSMLQIMESAGISTRKETALPIIHQLGTNVASIEKAIHLLKELYSEGKGVHVAGFNSVLYAAAKAKRLDLVKETFSLASRFGITPDVDTYNCLLDASIFATDWEYGNHVWNLIRLAKVKPNSTSYSKMVVLCCTQDDYEDCFRYLEEMKYFKYVPPRGCYQLLIKKLASDGDDRVHIAIEDMRASGYEVPQEITELVTSASSDNIKVVVNDGTALMDKGSTASQ